MKLSSRTTSWALVGLIALNIAGTAYYFVLQQQIRQARPRPSMIEGSKFPAFSGINVLGEQWKASNAPCRVIRIADDHCQYCKKDKPSWEKLVDAARNSSCEVIEMAPQAGGMVNSPRPGIVQLKYVDVDVGSMLFPFATPQTIILGRDWSVRLNRRGMFDKQLLAGAVALFGALSRPPVAQ